MVALVSPIPYPNLARLQDRRHLIAHLIQLTPDQLLTHCTDILCQGLTSAPNDDDDDVILDLRHPEPDPRSDLLSGRNPSSRPAFSPTPLAALERWCPGCREAWPVEAFCGNKTHTGNLQSHCRACMAEHQRRYDNAARPVRTQHTPLAVPGHCHTCGGKLPLPTHAPGHPRYHCLTCRPLDAYQACRSQT